MKPIRSLILIAIGMLAFTGTASTTANLEQKQKSFIVTEYTVPTLETQVVDIFKEITLTQEALVSTVSSVNLKQTKAVQKFYVVAKDVGWRCPKISIKNLYKENLPGNLKQKIFYHSQIQKNCRNIC